MQRTGIILMLVLLSLAAVPASARAADDGASRESRTFYFYHGRTYGSEALVDPVRLVVAGGFGIMQLDNRSNRLGDIDYREGTHNLFRNLAHPVWAIEASGWKNFLGSEVLPFNITPHRAYYWPNYTQHMVGGGMSYRMMEEWFTQHGSDHPRAWALLTIGLYHGLNEVVENDSIVGPRPDPVADVYIFNPAGVLLFSNDSVCRFFSETLHLTDWSAQPVLVPDGMRLENSAQNFAIKYRLPFLRRTSLFYYFGAHGEGGLSWKRANGEAISVAAGFRGSNFELITDTVNTVSLTASAGIFYDREGSLLASLQFADSKDYRLRLNVYPGVLRVGGWSPGVVLAANQDKSIIAGITVGARPFVPAGLAIRE